MKPLSQRLLNRGAAVFNNSLLLSLPSFSNLVLSLLVVRLFAQEWWGMIVELQLTFYIVMGVCAWGNKEYLLRSFSESPSLMRFAWKQSLAGRSPLLLLSAAAVLIFIHPGISGVHVMIWIACRFLYQSFESIATFEKKFRAMILSEVAALAVVCSLLGIFRDLSFERVLGVISLGRIVKTLVLIPAYSSFLFNDEKWSFGFRQLRASAGFMLLAFTGLLQTKCDLIMMNFLLSKEDLGAYQLFTSFLLLTRSITSFIIYPFAKNIYRLKKGLIGTIAIQLGKYGLLICAAGLLVQYLAITWLYNVTLSWQDYLFGFISVLPGFWFAPIVFYLFRMNRQMSVVWVNIFGTAVSAAACWLLIPPFGITGALAATGIAQLAMLAWYYLDFNRSSVGPATA